MKNKDAINIEAFLINLRSFFAPQYKPSQKPGFEIIVNKFYELGYSDLRWLAYILATAYHETAHTMKPVTEYGSQKYLRSKKYWPFIGRGYVQITWDWNYEKYGIKDTPEKALEPDFAAFILIDGMVKGIFTGKKLKDYFNNLRAQPVNARRIVNGTDKAQLIAGYHDKIYRALEASKIEFKYLASDLKLS